MLYKITDDNLKSIMTFGKYSMSYCSSNDIITAVPNTLGIMLFDGLTNVELFIQHYIGEFSSYRILIAEANDIILIPEYVCTSVSEKCLDEFYNQSTWLKLPPKGTVCCQSIKILREIFT